jgi:hypothetical protein
LFALYRDRQIKVFDIEQSTVFQQVQSSFRTKEVIPVADINVVEGLSLFAAVLKQLTHVLKLCVAVGTAGSDQ